MSCAAGPDINENGLVLALDASNKKSYSQNEFLYPTDIFAWCGSTGHNNATISRGTTTSPVGTTPMQMVVTGTDPHIGTYNTGIWNIAPSPGTQRWIVSVYAKASTNTTGEIVMFGANSSGTSFVGGNWLAIAGQLINITTEWQRFSAIIDFNNASIANIHVRFDGPDSGGVGQTIWWDGLQVERVPSGTTTPTPFTSSYYGGSVFRDLVGSNNGTLTNYPTYNGANGGSLSFDGVDDYVSCGTFFNYTNFTISLWAYPGSTQVQYADIFDNNHTGTQNFVCQQNVSNTNQYNFGCLNATNASITSAFTLTANTWHYLTFTWNNSVASAYINGVFHSSGSAANPINYTNPNLSIARWGSGGRNWNGRVSNFTAHNRVLTLSEIQQNFNATRGRYGI